MSHDEQIRQIRQKLQMLVKKYQALKQENESLREQSNQFQEKTEKLQETIETLSNRNTLAKMQLSELNPEDRIVLKKKIDLYLKEIDKCIASINIQ